LTTVVLGSIISVYFNILKGYLYYVDLRRRRTIIKYFWYFLIVFAIDNVLEFLLRIAFIPVVFLSTDPWGISTYTTILTVAQLITHVLVSIGFIVKLFVVRSSKETIELV
jgi:membrane protease YdiL (CAAX protease family)